MGTVLLSILLFAKTPTAWPRPLPARPDKSGVERQRAATTRQFGGDKPQAPAANIRFFQWDWPAPAAQSQDQTPPAPTATGTPNPPAPAEPAAGQQRQ